ncbi:hypothetical protein BGZ95_006107 [Linnemannia exigua]|uniref:Uncharacterized protein n=1 Tax=Linnemannia exigua TaxID=604196 RepID=A0AAD4D1S2_9FUNG|nr:hypothetical protein BGZ95_006107 [Linnemannia exigua]
MDQNALDARRNLQVKFLSDHHFQHAKAALDAFRRALRAVDSKNHPWALAYLEEAKGEQHLCAEKEDMLDKKTTRDRRHQTTSELTGILGRTLSRQTIRTNFRLLEADNETLDEVVMGEIKASAPSFQPTTAQPHEENGAARKRARVGSVSDNNRQGQEEEEELHGLQEENQVDKFHTFYYIFQALFDIHYKRPLTTPNEPPNLTCGGIHDRQRGHDRGETVFGDQYYKLCNLVTDNNFSVPPNCLTEIASTVRNCKRHECAKVDACKAWPWSTMELGKLAQNELMNGRPMNMRMVLILELIRFL